MARTPKHSYKIRRGSDGKTCIYLRSFNVRLATFNANSDELIDLLRKMFDDAHKSAATYSNSKPG